MYTLRLFKNKNETNRTQIGLGDSYTVKGADDSDLDLGIILRVFRGYSGVPNDGLCIYQDDYAFIMTDNGKTFETLNKPTDVDLMFQSPTDKYISFGNYLLSEKRKKSFENHPDPSNIPLEDRLKIVDRVDVENWKHYQK